MSRGSSISISAFLRTRVMSLVFLGATIVFSTSTAWACQEGCVIVEVSGSKFVLESSDPQAGANPPIPNATVIIRSAANNAQGQNAICARRGPVVKRLRTDANGNFDLGRIGKGQYWITYVNQSEGQSFLISIANRKNSKPTELIAKQLSGLCYLIDVEQNVTRPQGWAIPVDLDLVTSSPLRVHCKALRIIYGPIQVANLAFRITKLEPKSQDGVTVDGWNHLASEVVQTDSHGVIRLSEISTVPYLIEPNWKSDLSRAVFSNNKKLEECTEDLPLSQIVTDY